MRLSLASKTVTLNIESNSLRMLVASGRAVEKWASSPLEAGLVREGMIIEPEKVGQAIANLFKAQGAPRGRLVTCISGIRALSQIMTLPKMDPSLLKNAVMYQAKREMPVPLEELVLAWQVVGTAERQQDIFVLGVPREVIDAHVQALRHAGLRPRAVDLKPLALARVVDRSTAIIGNLEADTIDILYIRDDVPVLMRTVSLSNGGVSPSELRDRLVEELDRTIRYYNDTNRHRPVGPGTSIFLAGGVGDFPTMASAMYGRLEYTLEPMSPPLRCPSGLPVEEYAVNIGLALKELK